LDLSNVNFLRNCNKTIYDAIHQLYMEISVPKKFIWQWSVVDL